MSYVRMFCTSSLTIVGGGDGWMILKAFAAFPFGLHTLYGGLCRA